jgi:molybdopterin molybdotransferase
VGDDPGETREAVKRGIKSDCLLITGGVSAGAYDFVEDILSELGVEIHTSRIAVKPGKPTVFGTIGDKLVFGLPGNPVSTVVIARVLVEPALKKMQGFSSVGPRIIKAKLTRDIRKKPDRLWFVHGRLNLDQEISVEPLKNRGSADIPAAAAGDCLIMAPKGVSLVEQSSLVEVVIWNRSF